MEVRACSQEQEATSHEEYLPQTPANGLGIVGEPQVFLRLVSIRQGKLEASLVLILVAKCSQLSQLLFRQVSECWSFGRQCSWERNELQKPLKSF